MQEEVKKYDETSGESAEAPLPSAEASAEKSDAVVRGEDKAADAGGSAHRDEAEPASEADVRTEGEAAPDHADEAPSPKRKGGGFLTRMRIFFEKKGAARAERPASKPAAAPAAGEKARRRSPSAEAAPFGLGGETSTNKEPAKPLKQRRVSKPHMATCLCFALAGFVLAVWATLVPYVKTDLGLNEGEMGALLLCLGLGALLTMPLSGGIVSKYGCRRVLKWSVPITTSFCAMLPASHDAGFTAVLLLGFGGAFGIMDVAMSVHAVEVDKKAGRPVLSNIYAFYPIGGVLGSTTMSAMLHMGLPIIPCVIAFTSILSLMWLQAGEWILGTAGRTKQKEKRSGFALPRGIVLVYGAVVFVMYLADGAILDWGGLLLTHVQGAAMENAGMGYAIFSLALTIMRLFGGRISERVGSRNMVLLGGIIGAAAFAAAVVVGHPIVTFAAFFVLGLAASNITPITFSEAGRQRDMPVSTALAAVTTVGYSGILVGPAMIGAIAQATSLEMSFFFVAGLLVLVAAASRFYPKR